MSTCRKPDKLALKVAAGVLVHCSDRASDSLPPDMPFFILIAQDAFSVGLVRRWIQLAEDAGVSPEKTQEAFEAYEAMRAWRPKKLPD